MSDKIPIYRSTRFQVLAVSQNFWEILMYHQISWKTFVDSAMTERFHLYTQMFISSNSDLNWPVKLHSFLTSNTSNLKRRCGKMALLPCWWVHQQRVSITCHWVLCKTNRFKSDDWWWVRIISCCKVCPPIVHPTRDIKNPDWWIWIMRSQMGGCALFIVEIICNILFLLPALVRWWIQIPICVNS